MKSIFTFVGTVYILSLMVMACSKFTELPIPDHIITSDKAYSSDSAATRTLMGVYIGIMEQVWFFNGNGSKHGSLYVHEIVSRNNLSAQDSGFNSNNLPVEYKPVALTWKLGFGLVTGCNEVIENLKYASAVSERTKQQLTAEARFLRALSYFYLVNLFGGVPLIVGTDFMNNSLKPRSSVEEVYQFVISDLQHAASVLPEEYKGNELLPYRRIRATKWAAIALLARVQLYKGNWIQAELNASSLIDSGWFELADIQSVYHATSKETILQFQPKENTNTAESSFFLLGWPQNKPSYTLSDSVVSLFLSKDKRQTTWLWPFHSDGRTYFGIYKWKAKNKTPNTEYNIVLRFAECYLIRAEARIRLNKLREAVDDLNTIRKRAHADTLREAISQEAMLLALARERQLEFFAEWAHGFFDLKRWYLFNNFDDPLYKLSQNRFQAIPGWQAWKLQWPIPQDEIVTNFNLIQNEGYNP